jgi:hypothetical protein
MLTGNILILVGERVKKVFKNYLYEEYRQEISIEEISLDDLLSDYFKEPHQENEYYIFSLFLDQEFSTELSAGDSEESASSTPQDLWKAIRIKDIVLGLAGMLGITENASLYGE